MGSSDNFCLRWNDFESNISSSFQELRQNSEFFDVTLCCDNGKDIVQAHKVILASCSPFFRQILSYNTHKNPFLYLKGIQQKELLNVLHFMYNGEVNVAQESLNAFLAAAEELAVKGLSSHEGVGASKKGNYYKEENHRDDDDGPFTSTKRSLKKSSSKRRSAASALSKRKPDQDMSGGEDSEDYDLKRIKSEPEVMIGTGLDTGLDDFEEGGGGGGPPGGKDDDFENFGHFDDEGADFDESIDDLSRPSGADGDTKEELVEARFSRTQLGNALLVDPDGFCYCINRKREKRIYWVCHQQRRYKCRGSAITEGFFIVKRGGAQGHTHTPYPLPQNKYTKDL